MLRHVTVPLARAWNSWSMRPVELAFLPLGVRLTPVLYSTKLRKTSEVLPREGSVRLGRHTIDGRLIEAETEHAGTSLRFRYLKADPFAVSGSWEGTTLGEWGLRFWVSLALSAEGGEPVDYLAERGGALIKVGARFVAIKTADTPVQVTGHDSIAALRADFEANGYFHLASRAASAPVLALRFNLEMMRSGRFAAAVADSADLAFAKAEALLATPPAVPALAGQSGRFAGALDAVRDIVAWNTIWDETNARPYTTVSRIWNLGTFAVWYNDQTYAALLAGLFDTDLARENMAVALAGATPQGNVACIVTSNDAWVDRSQPPHGAFVAWQLFQRTGDRALLANSFEALARNQRWWRANRDPEDRGLISCGTSPVGEALYAGTAFGARNETGMDNSPTHDEAVYDPATRTLSTFDLGLNCALALDAEMLAEIAGELGFVADAAEFAALAETSRRLIRDELWDADRGLFANRQRGGGFVRSVSPTSFYPLICGAASPEQAARLLDHLDDPRMFGGTYPLPNVSRDDPAYGDNVYWRGRIWPNVNYTVWQGLRRYGFRAAAGLLADKSFAMFMQSWTERRIAAENYNAETGEPLDQGDTDPFYIWAALLPLMAVGEVTDVSPWAGFELVHDGQAFELGPLATPAGQVTLVSQAGEFTLRRGSSLLLSTDLIGRLSRIRLTDTLFSCTLDRRSGSRLVLPWADPARIVAVRLDGADLPWQAEAGGLMIALGESGRLSVHLAPA